MSHQSGIGPDGGLRMAFNDAQENDSKIRAMKIVIDDEQLCLDYQEKIVGTMHKDWVRMLPQCLQDKQPCYVLIRQDSCSNSHELVNSWVLLTYVPEKASVKDKMLHAATRSTLKSCFGPQFISYELQATSKGEATVEAYLDFLSSTQERGPMSDLEAGRLAAQTLERNAASDGKNSSLRGIVFPIDQKGEESLHKLVGDEVNYIQLSVDTLNEAIKFEKALSISTDELQGVIPKADARYHFYRYKHNYNGISCDSIVFIYSMPSQGCSIKDKMLYSSCKAPFLENVQRHLSVSIEKKVEVDDTDVVNEQFLSNLLHPPIIQQQLRFSKPPGPARRPQQSRQMVR